MCAASPLMIEGDRKPNPNGLKQRENVLKFMFTSLKSRVPLARRAHISLLALLTSTLTPFEDKHCPFSVSTGGYGTSRSYLPPRSLTERKGPLPGGGSHATPLAARGHMTTLQTNGCGLGVVSEQSALGLDPSPYSEVWRGEGSGTQRNTRDSCQIKDHGSWGAHPLMVPERSHFMDLLGTIPL